jgi:hypothetical protein
VRWVGAAVGEGACGLRRRLCLLGFGVGVGLAAILIAAGWRAGGDRKIHRVSRSRNGGVGRWKGKARTRNGQLGTETKEMGVKCSWEGEGQGEGEGKRRKGKGRASAGQGR